MQRHFQLLCLFFLLKNHVFDFHWLFIFSAKIQRQLHQLIWTVHLWLHLKAQSEFPMTHQLVHQQHIQRNKRKTSFLTNRCLQKYPKVMKIITIKTRLESEFRYNILKGMLVFSVIDRKLFLHAEKKSVHVKSTFSFFCVFIIFIERTCDSG